MADEIVIPVSGTGSTATSVAVELIGGKNFQLMKLVSGAVGSQVTIGAGSGASDTALRMVLATDAPLPAGANSIGTVHAQLLAGTASIGSVNVLALPALIGGTASIGSVNVLALPATPAGSNSIGTVHAQLLGGTASIGSVNVLALPTLPAGVNSIGSVNVLALPTLPSGTNSIGTVHAQLLAGVASIGSVNVLALPTLPAGTNSIGTVHATLLAGTNTNEVVGDVAHDVAVAGNPLVVAGTSQDMDDTAPPNRTSAEGRTTRLAMDRDGAAFVHPHGPQIWSYHTNVSAALTDVAVHAAPSAGLSLYVGTITFSSGAATAINAFFEEGSTVVLGPYYLEAVAGRGMTVSFNPPKKITAATALTVTTSAAIAHSIDVTGFVGPG